MNDFKKEELLTIQELIVWSDDSYESQSERVRSVQNKIQSMIDNYCEHDYIGSMKHCIDCGVSEFRCNKCGYVSYDGLE